MHETINNLRANSFRGAAADPRAAISAFTSGIDAVLRTSWERRMGPHADGACLIALGGYGRAELFPHSDVDILVLHALPADGEAIAALVRDFWDMGLLLGCVVRTPAECRRILGEDLATDIALWESRCLAGSERLFESQVREAVASRFSRHRNSYRHELLAALHDGLFSAASAIFRIEPDVKNGPCCLRDCQRMLWLSRLSSPAGAATSAARPSTMDEQARFTRAYGELSRLRCALHLVAGRRQDTLEIALQPEVARRAGRDGPGALMEGFFKTVRDVNRLLQGFVEHEGRRDILGSLRARAGSTRIGNDLRLIDGVITPASFAAVPAMTPEAVLRIYAASLDYQALPSTRLRDAMRRAIEGFAPASARVQAVGSAFQRILSTGHHAGAVLRDMHDTGALTMAVPEFSTLVCKVEYDAYHEFTADEHCIMAIHAFDALAADADQSVRICRRGIARPGLLRAAILLHDIGKAAPGDHTISGATIAAGVCRRLGFTEEEAGRIVWLVRHHLDLANLALRREPEEPVLARFAETIIDAECLDMLYLLTIVDIRSVGSKTWTAWKGIQLAEVYRKTAALIKGTQSKSAVDATGADLLFPDSALAFEEEAASVQRSSDLMIRCQCRAGFDELVVCAMDRPRLFADIVACISSEGYNILSARITTRSDDRILDVFHVESDGTTTVSPEERARNIAGKWDLLCRGAVAAETLIAQRRARYPAGARRETGAAGVSVIIDNSASGGCSVLEIEAPDRFGLLHRIAQTLARFEVNIVSARILTRIDRAIDVFYITDATGCKIDGAEEQQAITRSLREALEGIA